MVRFLTLLLFAFPIWAQFQPAPQQPQYPSQAPAGYPPQYDAQSQYPAQQPYPGQQQNPAQDDQQGRDWATDQQHGVARLRIAQGDVNVKRGDNGLLTGAIANAPLLSHDHLETGPGSRAEAELDPANVIRLAPDTDLGFANLAFGHAQLQVAIGSVVVRVLRDSQAQLELDTPSVAFHPLSQGDYRISVFNDGTSQITVRSGSMEMYGPHGSQTVEQGQSLMVRGDASDPEFQQAPQPPRDQFDDWSAARDAEEMSVRSAQYVPPDVSGAEDLDRYGNWVPSQYGQVWAPQGQGPDWSPYSNGQWTYADYYGWTWVGYEPWGWAPYHYGRWFWNSGVGWCWWPGLRAGIGLGFNWSPALVGFFGFGGGLGWVALAPFELFHAWWGHGFGGFGAFGGYNGLHMYRNAAIRGGAMTAGFNSFAGAAHHFSVATAGQIRSASLYRGALPVSPNAAGYRFSDRAVSANPRFSQAASRSFFSHSQQSFNGARSGSFNAGRSGATSSGGGGWQHFGSPAPQRQQSQGFSSRQNGTAESGWHNFGTPRYSAPSAPNNSYRAPSAPSYGGYRAPSTSNYGGYRAPAAPHYSAPSAPHYSAPRGNSGGGGGESKHSSGGGGGKHAGGGGGHSGGGGGHHGR
jgi:hypothetical protein